MKKIVIVEDDVFMREEIVNILQKASYGTECITDFLSPADSILAGDPDLVILDLNLPGLSGFAVCRMLRQKSTVPVLVLTSRDQLKDELNALSMGADEYLTKPCHSERLLARIANLLRRSEDRKYLTEYGDMRLDVRTYTLESRDGLVVLPENQGKMMEMLLAAQGELVTRQMLFMKLWGTTDYVDENALQVNMTRLKRNLARLNLQDRIVTVRGEGYRLRKAEEWDDVSE